MRGCDGVVRECECEAMECDMLPTTSNSPRYDPILNPNVLSKATMLTRDTTQTHTHTSLYTANLTFDRGK